MTLSIFSSEFPAQFHFGEKNFSEHFEVPTAIVVAAPSIESAYEAAGCIGPNISERGFNHFFQEDVIPLEMFLRSGFEDHARQNYVGRFKRIVEKLVADTPGFQIGSIVVRLKGLNDRSRMYSDENGFAVHFIRMDVSLGNARRIVYIRPSEILDWRRIDHIDLINHIHAAF